MTFEFATSSAAQSAVYCYRFGRGDEVVSTAEAFAAARRGCLVRRLDEGTAR
jgi:hypothetical protein